MSAIAVLRDMLNEAGLGSLANTVWNSHKQGFDYDYIYEQITESGAYKTRFSGLVALREKDRAAGMSEGEYLALESAMRRDLEESGFGGTRFTRDSYLGQVIGNEVSEDEFRARIQMAELAATTLPVDVRRELRERYGIRSNQVVEYYMDTDSTQKELLRQQQAATLAAQYERFQTMEVSTSAMERLAADVATNPSSIPNANEAFEAMGTLGEGLSAEERLRGALGLNRQLDLERRRREAAYSGGGTAAQEAEGVTGLAASST